MMPTWHADLNLPLPRSSRSTNPSTWHVCAPKQVGVSPSFEGYEEDGAWPLLLDE